MTYLDKALNSYRDSMMSMGVSEDVVNFCLYGFEIGFRAGTLYHGDIMLQEKMVEGLLKENNLN